MAEQTSGSSATAPAGLGSSLSAQQVTQAIQSIYLGILEAIKAGGTRGAPGGVIYAALQPAGASLDQYQQFMRLITGRGFAMLEGKCYRLTASGLAFIPILRRKLAQSSAAQDAAGQAGETR